MFIVKVNGYEIKPKEFKAELYQLNKKSENDEVSEKIKSTAINNLIDGYLLLQHAKSGEYEIDEQKILNQFRQLQSSYNSKQEFKQELKKFSIDSDRIIQQIRNQFLIKKFIQKQFKDKINIDPKLILAYYKKNKKKFRRPEKVHLMHCLVDKNDPNASKKAEIIEDKLNDSVDFCDIVEEYSVCPSNKNSGDLGYVKRGKFIAELEEVVFSLPEGDHAGPIRTEFGTHFVKVVDKKPSYIPEFEEIKDSLKRHLEKITSEIELLKFIRECRDKATIEIQKDYL